MNIFQLPHYSVLFMLFLFSLSFTPFPFSHCLLSPHHLLPPGDHLTQHWNESHLFPCLSGFRGTDCSLVGDSANNIQQFHPANHVTTQARCCVRLSRYCMVFSAIPLFPPLLVLCVKPHRASAKREEELRASIKTE